MVSREWFAVSDDPRNGSASHNLESLPFHHAQQLVDPFVAVDVDKHLLRTKGTHHGALDIFHRQQKLLAFENHPSQTNATSAWLSLGMSTEVMKFKFGDQTLKAVLGEDGQVNRPGIDGGSNL
ncbi:hypothetical protein GALL_176990 [mine drainage metagenome]|uniref:Uncharacterized protein n=1 Tax=mine drainage metagenome TaxID=410659 RepID=A0A1J5RVK2_9ZZZZ